MNALTGSVRVERIGSATLYCGDCAHILPSLKADAVVTDPPYGIAFRHSGKGSSVQGYKSFQRHSSKVIGDDSPFDPEMIMGFPKVVLFGANHFAHRLPPSPAWLVWDKRDGMESNSFSDCEMAWTKGAGNAARLIRYLWNGVCQAGEKGERRLHPTQKPVAVMQWCIQQLRLPPQAIIIDPYMGSGSTLVAAVRMGHPCVGIEIDPDHFDAACKRLRDTQRQPDLFIAPSDAADAIERLI